MWSLYKVQKLQSTVCLIYVGALSKGNIMPSSITALNEKLLKAASSDVIQRKEWEVVKRTKNGHSLPRVS